MTNQVPSPDTASRVCRPPNAFILFRNDTQPTLVEQYRGQGMSSKDFSAIVGQMWREAPESVKSRYQDLAKSRMTQHRIMYPDFQYRSPIKKAKVTSTPKRKGARIGKVKSTKKFGALPGNESRTLRRQQQTHSPYDSSDESSFSEDDLERFKPGNEYCTKSPVIENFEEAMEIMIQETRLDVDDANINNPEIEPDLAQALHDADPPQLETREESDIVVEIQSQEPLTEFYKVSPLVYSDPVFIVPSSKGPGYSLLNSHIKLDSDVELSESPSITTEPKPVPAFKKRVVPPATLTLNTSRGAVAADQGGMKTGLWLTSAKILSPLTAIAFNFNAGGSVGGGDYEVGVPGLGTPRQGLFGYGKVFEYFGGGLSPLQPIAPVPSGI